MRFNEQIMGLKPSKSMVFMQKAKELKLTDPDIIDLSGGEPDFNTPFKVREEAKKWIDAGYTHYTIGPGLPELRRKISEKLNTENGFYCQPENILVTPGCKFAIYLAVRSLVNPGDKVAYFEPAWVSYPSIIEASCAIGCPIRLSEKNNFSITSLDLEKISEMGANLLILNYPNNPTGKILSLEEAELVRDFLISHPNLRIISDEIYEKIVFDGEKSVSLGSFPQISDRVITVNGFSKSVAMTGWRIGYLAASKEVLKVIYKLYQHTVSCVCGFTMKAAVVALDCNDEIENMRKEFEDRRNMFVQGLNKINGVHCLSPKGAFYAWVRFNLPRMDSEAACDYILNNAKIVGVPGNAYGTDECYIRFSFATTYRILEEALGRLEKLPLLSSKQL